MNYPNYVCRYRLRPRACTANNDYKIIRKSVILVFGRHYPFLCFSYPPPPPPHFFLQVISCPVQSSSGGALVSLEASTTPESLVIVWPVQCDPRTTGITAYSVLINGQPFGEQVSMRNNCCFLLSWDKIKRGSHFLCHARCLAHFRVRTMILRISFSFKTVCYVKSHVHCYLTTGLYISHVLVCHETTLKPPRSPLPQNNMILRTN